MKLDKLQEELKRAREELEYECLAKGLKSKLAGIATAGALAVGSMSSPASADVGHVKSYLNNMHGMELGGHKVEVSHKDITRPEFKGSNDVGAGKFTVKVGDYQFHGKYSRAGKDHNEIKLTKPHHSETKQGLGLEDLGDDAIAMEQLHDHLTGKAGDSKGLSLFETLMRERTTKSDDERTEEVIKALDEMGKRESALLLKNWGKMDDTARKVDEGLDKSNYGPKEYKMYDPKDNVQRKQTRTGEVHEDIGQNKAVQQYTSATMGTAKDQATAEAREAKEKNKKQPVKVYTEEEKRALEEQYRKEGKL